MNDRDRCRIVAGLNELIDQIGSVLMMSPDIRTRNKLAQMAQVVLDEIERVQSEADTYTIEVRDE